MLVRLIVSTPPTVAQRDAAVALLSGAVAVLGKLEARAGRLARADVSGFVTGQLATIQAALDGAPVDVALARMVHAALTTAGCAAVVV